MNSFEKIYADNYRAIYRAAVKMLGSCAEVQDIVQDVFVDFFHKWNDGSTIFNPGAWLYRATFNKCIDHHRKQKFIDGQQAYILPPEESQPFEVFEMREMIQTSMSVLQPREQELVVLYSEGLSYKEMAEITGIGFTSVGKTLSRSLRKMELELKKSMGHEVFR